MTLGDKDDVRFISGAPRVFDGKVIIGHGGADVGAIRGYVTAYDAETGKQLWRFYAVPGQPGVDTDETTQIASKTWAGKWWTQGGGGTVWNAITYDKEFDTIYIGTGNGAPWNRKVRSAGQGDNLFLCSVVALDAKTGKYKWHYQTNPGESWDYNSSMDMQLADLTIDGKPRKALMHAPKNGFLYVIDRKDGKLISAEPFVPVTWAKGIDLKTGRPIENPNIRYENGPVTVSPGPNGAHSWTPMAYSPQTRLVYIPTIEMATTYDDRGIPLENWKRMPGAAIDFAVMPAMASGGARSSLVAIDPVTQKHVWQVPTPAHFPAGVMATGGGLVFQGQSDAKFNAYEAKTGKLLWSFDAKAPIVSPPISYKAGGRQYVTLIVGAGVTAGFLGTYFQENGGVEYRSQARRILTFALDGKQTLPARVPYKAVATEDPDFYSNDAAAEAGMATYIRRCFVCHGGDAISGGLAPDLRTSEAITDKDVFTSIVHEGMLVPNGMPRFEELSEMERENLRQYIRTRANELRKAGKATS
jgi:quinohemoprotein ethanol dehydrogenase